MLNNSIWRTHWAFRFCAGSVTPRTVRTNYSAKRVHEVINGMIERYQQEGHDKKFSLISLLLRAKRACWARTRLASDMMRREMKPLSCSWLVTKLPQTLWHGPGICWINIRRQWRGCKQKSTEYDGRTPTLQDVDELHYTRAVFDHCACTHLYLCSAVQEYRSDQRV